MGVVLHGGFFNCNIPHGHSHGGHGHSHGHSHGGAHSHGPSNSQNTNSSHSDFVNGEGRNPSVPTVSFSNDRQRTNTSNSRTVSKVNDEERMNLQGDDSIPDRSSNINVRAAYIHVLGDIIQSVGVLIAAYIIRYKVRI